MSEDFERRLRDVLRGPHLDVDPAADALERIHAGAARRQHRRVAASGSAGVAAVAVVAVVLSGLVMNSHHKAVTAEKTPRLTLPSASSPTPDARFGVAPLAPTPAPTTSQSATRSATASVALAPSASAPQEVAASLSSFTPVSVTAISENSYWVLGYEPSASQQAQTVVKATTDGGATFTDVSRPNILLSQVPWASVPDARMASDIRFADAKHGWIYGDILYETDDGGVSWKKLQTVSGNVIDLAAFSGSVWAVSKLSAGTTPTYGVFHATYSGDGATGAWSKVKLPFTLGNQPPTIAVQAGMAYILAPDDAAPDNGAQGVHDHLVSISADGKLLDHRAPCAVDLPARLSAGGAAGVLWATCVTGMQASIFVSDDAGSTWHEVPHGGNNGIEVGAISADAAVVSDALGDPIQLLHADGTLSPVTAPATSTGGADFIGFTTTDVGFALADADGTRQLWRTTDGGATWSDVQFKP